MHALRRDPQVGMSGRRLGGRHASRFGCVEREGPLAQILKRCQRGRKIEGGKTQERIPSRRMQESGWSFQLWWEESAWKRGERGREKTQCLHPEDL